jgi:molybdopterin converting factor subunit 1
VLVRVRLFALAKQRVGRPDVEVTLSENSTLRDLKNSLASDYPSLADLLPKLLFAVGTEYAEDDRILEAGANVAAIPPVSGG